MLGRWWSVDDGRLIARRSVDSFVGRLIDNDDTEMSELMAAGEEDVMILKMRDSITSHDLSCVFALFQRYNIYYTYVIDI